MTLLLVSSGKTLVAQGDNFRFGGMSFDLGATLGQSYDSNIGRAPDNEVSDWITHVGWSLSGDLELTEINRLRLRLGVGYRKYWRNPQLDSDRNFFILTPDTELALVAQAGNFSFRLYDNLTFDSDPGDQRFIDPDTGNVITNILAYNRFQNRVGIDGSWLINPFWSGQLGFFRLDVVPLDDEFRDFQRNQHTVSLGVTHYLAANMDVGANASYSINRWRTEFQPDSRTSSFGGVVRWQPSGSFETETSVAWTQQSFEASSGNQDSTRDSQGLTGSLTLRHFASPVVEHSVSYRRQLDLGSVSNSITVESVDYEVKYSGFERSGIDFGVGWYRGAESGGLSSEEFDRWIVRGGFGYDLSPQLDFRFSVEHSFRTSNLGTRDYSRNVVSVMFSYDF